MYIDELVTEADKWTGFIKDGEEEVVALADDMLLQATTELTLQNLLEVASWLKGRSAFCRSLPPCSYMQLP